MTTLEIISAGASIMLEGKRLRVARRGERGKSFPLDEIDLVILEVPHVSVTGAALDALSVGGIPVMVCNDKHRPAAWLQPVGAIAVFDARRAARQAGMSARTRGRLWRAIVRAKILSQADLLSAAGKPQARLRRIAKEVAAGDPANSEALAAQLYWPALFGRDFRRRGNSRISLALDWGYSVLRALTCRGLVAAGLHPAIGMHHIAPNNGFNLADDLMEPYRPVVDRLLHRLWLQNTALTPAHWKLELAQVGEHPIRIDGNAMRCRAAVAETVASFVRIVDLGKGSLALPKQIMDVDDARRMAADVAGGLL